MNSSSKNLTFRLILIFSFAGSLFFNQGGPVLIARSAPNFATPAFQPLWDYSDKVVNELPGAGRAFTWGPTSLGSLVENYKEGPGGQRTVQYFDKSRMELSAEGKLITSGLLTEELVTGKRQDGDNSFTQLTPSQVQVAGDDNSSGRNSISPVYASFEKVVTLGSSNNRVANQTGKTANLFLDKAGTPGTIGASSLPAFLTLGYYDPVLGHNIPQIFVDFENKQGPVWNGSAYTSGKVFTENPVAAVFGYPISEPYWVRAEVQHQEQFVLVQLFERRVLTFTPKNADPFKVEMGNLGAHYLRWRYSGLAPPVSPPATHLVVIDPGHGGEDPGAVHTGANGQDDLFEKTVTLQLALKTAELLKEQGFKVILTRYGDVSPNNPPQDLNGDGVINIYDDLQARVNLANKAQAELFLSIHLNSTPGKNQSGGIQTIFCDARPFSTKSYKFAQLIQQESVTALNSLAGYRALDRGVLDDLQIDNDGRHLFVLGPGGGGNQKSPVAMPGALTEALFINNDAEAALYSGGKTILALATGYTRAVKLYFAS